MEILSVVLALLAGLLPAFAVINKVAYNGSLLVAEDSVHLALFHTKWCGSCKHVKNDFIQLDSEALPQLVLYDYEPRDFNNVTRMYDVQTFPSIYYQYKDVKGIYQGSRNLDSIRKLYKTLLSEKHTILTSLEQIDTVLSTGEVAFVFQDTSCASSIDYSTLPKFNSKEVHQIANANILKATILEVQCSKSSNEYVFFKVEAGNAAHTQYYNSKMDVSKFIAALNKPIVAYFDDHIYKQALSHSSYVILLVVDVKKGIHSDLIEKFTEFVQSLDHSHYMDFSFGILDGKRWPSFCVDHDLFVPDILALRSSGDLYNVISVRSAFSIENSMKTLLDDIDNDAVAWIESHPAGSFRKMIYRIKSYYPWSMLIFAPVLFFVGSSLFFKFPEDLKKKD